LVPLCLLTALSCGCGKFARQEPFPWFGEQDDVVAPTRISAMWTDTVMYQPDQPGVRGIGGRFYFFGEKDDKPVRVDGTLTVYAFDAVRDDRNVKPEKKFVFLPDQLTRHHSESSIGHSYSFWLPWGEVGGPPRQLSVIARFAPKAGAPVLSQSAKIVLPGLESQPAPEPATEPMPVPYAAPDVAPAAFAQTGWMQQPGEAPEPQVEREEAEPEEVEPPETERETFTITVPPQFLRHTRGATSVPVQVAGDQENGSTVTVTARSMPNRPADAPSSTRAPAADPKQAQPASQAEESEAALPAPPTRFAPWRFPARIAPTIPSARDPAQKPPYRAAWPSRRQPTPRWDQTRQTSPSAPTDQQSVR
jgi:hypothetical protein